MMRKKRALFPLLLAVLLMTLASGIAMGNGHVPAGQVQVSHKARVAINVDAPALQAHIGHGDVRLPACDLANVFQVGDPTSDVLAASFAGVMYTGGFVDRIDGAGVGACVAGDF